jgi:hypothetical protein
MQATEDQTQQQCTIIHAEALVAALKKAADVKQVKSAVMTFITNMDLRSEVEAPPELLGDGDLSLLFAQYLERRGKIPVESFAAPIMRAQLHAAETTRIGRD